jgi:hypothetical protein
MTVMAREESTVMPREELVSDEEEQHRHGRMIREDNYLQEQGVFTSTPIRSTHREETETEKTTEQQNATTLDQLMKKVIERQRGRDGLFFLFRFPVGV